MHFHKWEVIEEKVDLNSSHAGWVQVTRKCSVCGKLSTIDGDVVGTKHIAAPAHNHTVVDAGFDSSDWPPPACVGYCENCGHTFRSRAARDGGTYLCPYCGCGTWLNYYYRPCCVDALREIESDDSKWTERK